MEYLILYKKLFYQLTPEECEIFDRWFSASAEHREYFRKLEENVRKRKQHGKD
ncbi:hypothetical protein [Sinomicrobium pectinilyticum]|uniref:hypothetical protein n=1 Tax=Sinomicrobium pectinilyticum TaxID=1084421 RepID=UPI0014761300|nr:hypothetical protein [Sinomicrobium pectinilyticum]